MVWGVPFFNRGEVATLVTTAIQVASAALKAASFTLPARQRTASLALPKDWLTSPRVK